MVDHAIKQHSFSAPVPQHLKPVFRASLLFRIPAECTNARRCRTGEGAEESALVSVDGEVTHLPQWRGEPTIAAAAASRPSSSVRPSAKGVQRDGEATRAHPQCYSPPPPPPHDPSLPSVSTWHGVIRSLLRPKNKPAEYKYLGGCR